MLINATETASAAPVAAAEPANNAARQRRQQASAPAPRAEPVASSAASNASALAAADAAKAATAAPDDAGSGPSAAAGAASANTPSEYRLVYDEEFSRTFVQIVDRSSGEEILRFPPEELVKFIDRSIGRPGAGDTSGLFLDRSV